MPTRRRASRDNKRSTDNKKTVQRSRNNKGSRDRRRQPSASPARPVRPPVAVRKASAAKPSAKATQQLSSKADEGSTTAAPDLVVDMVRRLLEMGVAGVDAQYNAVALYHPQPRRVTGYKANVARNRYIDVDCNDETRVVLAGHKTDYIHANWVNGGSVQTICSQGPLPNTAVDHWHMVWQEEMTLIIMLCDVVENKRAKCEQYWPDAVGDTSTYGPYTVAKVGARNQYLAGGYEVRESTFEFTHDECAPRTVLHAQLKDWPDRGVLGDARAILKLRRYMKLNAQGKPVLIHCSAGVGRTGTFVLIDMCVTQIEAGQSLDLVANFRRLREQRYHSVQTLSQFRFICVALLDYAEAKYHYMGDYNKNQALRTQLLAAKPSTNKD